MLVRCLVHTPVRTPMYGLPLSQPDQRIHFVFQSVHNKMQYEPQFHEMNGITKPLQILICCHENSRFLSLVVFRSGFTIEGG